MTNWAKAVSDFEKPFLVAALEKAGGNISEAARLVQKSPGAMHHLLEKHKLLPSEACLKPLR